MAKKMQVCRNCKRFTNENICPSCKSSNMSSSWKGVVVIIDTGSDIAKALNITEPGKYALYVG
jgi:RNA polymerase subunit RPABC4/transcription elongation factor Spt4